MANKARYETDDGCIHMNPIERSEADKELDAAIKSGKRDIPFPGDDALGPEEM